MSSPHALLTACGICSGVTSHGSVRIADCSRNRHDCQLCHLLSTGIERWSETLPHAARIGVQKFEFLQFKDARDTSFTFELWSTPASDLQKPPQFDVSLDCADGKPQSLIETHALPQDLPTQLVLQRVVSFIERWTASCDTYHPLCSVEPAGLPKRVLDVSSRESELVKLVALGGVYAPYIALSYCWGSSKSNISTTSTTIADHMRGIPTNALPRVFKDVLAICRAINIRYLWIDSLCIIQDSQEDWELESAKMATIYSNSHLTIAASACVDPQASLFSDRWTTVRDPTDSTHRVPIAPIPINCGDLMFKLRPQLHLAHDRFAQLDNAHHHAADAPLLTRAWAYQERLLPSRTLHFHAEELVWECKTGLRCECGIVDDPLLREAEACAMEESTLPSDAQRWLKSFIARVDHPNATHEELVSIWMDVVSEYTRLNLTSESDRLPALSGLAGKFLNTSLGDYIGGIWTKTLPIALLYYVMRDNDLSSSTDAYQPQAPSWSWASISLASAHGISYDRAIENFIAPSQEFQLVRATYKVLGKNPFGWVKRGVLKVRGLTVTCLAMRQEGGMALRIRNSRTQMRCSSRGDMMDLSLDHHDEEYDKILLLYLGSGFGLALLNVANHFLAPTAFRRVGIAQWTRGSRLWDKYWGKHMERRCIDLV
ncbi:HET-domain-containing protein [Byssothecium circinans]|uniref:HET-domain-containing protein n=1 Tax=Byssothecium circinans TaxID=147558 RepID=A0A6A5T7V5_9PLEO|nr:HET-domain-containing protein [Byssothecium circinans]